MPANDEVRNDLDQIRADLGMIRDPEELVRVHLAGDRPVADLRWNLARHAPGSDPDKIESEYQKSLNKQRQDRILANERERAAGMEESWSHYIGSRLPFAAVGELPHHIAHHRSLERYRAGNATAEDLRRIAERERFSNIQRDQTTGQQIGGAIAHVPGMIGEAAIGGGILRGFGLLPTPATATSAAIPGLLSAGPGAGLAARGGAFAAQTLAQTPLMPSMYLEQAVQRNAEQGRHPSDPRGFPAAVAMGAMQVAVLGSLPKVGAIVSGRDILSRSTRILAGTAAGLFEQHVFVEPLAGAISEILPEAYKLQTGYGLLGHAYNGEWGEAWKTFAVSLATFAAFSGAHEIMQGAPQQQPPPGQTPPGKPPFHGQPQPGRPPIPEGWRPRAPGPGPQGPPPPASSQPTYVPLPPLRPGSPSAFPGPTQASAPPTYGPYRSYVPPEFQLPAGMHLKPGETPLRLFEKAMVEMKQQGIPKAEVPAKAMEMLQPVIEAAQKATEPQQPSEAPPGDQASAAPPVATPEQAREAALAKLRSRIGGKGDVRVPAQDVQAPRKEITPTEPTPWVEPPAKDIMERARDAQLPQGQLERMERYLAGETFDAISKSQGVGAAAIEKDVKAALKILGEEKSLKQQQLTKEAEAASARGEQQGPVNTEIGDVQRGLTDKEIMEPEHAAAMEAVVELLRREDHIGPIRAEDISASDARFDELMDFAGKVKIGMNVDKAVLKNFPELAGLTLQERQALLHLAMEEYHARRDTGESSSLQRVIGRILQEANRRSQANAARPGGEQVQRPEEGARIAQGAGEADPNREAAPPGAGDAGAGQAGGDVVIRPSEENKNTIQLFVGPGEAKGEVEFGRKGGDNRVARSRFKGIIGEEEKVSRIHSVLLDESLRGKGFGQQMLLEAMKKHGSDWYYNSQTWPDLTNAIKALASKELIDVHWGGGKEPAWNKEYTSGVLIRIHGEERSGDAFVVEKGDYAKLRGTKTGKTFELELQRITDDSWNDLLERQRQQGFQEAESISPDNFGGLQSWRYDVRAGSSSVEIQKSEVKMRNPYVLDRNDIPETRDAKQKIIDKAKSMGHDGIIFKDKDDPTDSYFIPFPEASPETSRAGGDVVIDPSAIGRVKSLFEKAMDASLSFEEVKRELDDISSGLDKKGKIALAEEFIGNSQKGLSGKGAMEKIERFIGDRLQAHKRIESGKPIKEEKSPVRDFVRDIVNEEGGFLDPQAIKDFAVNTWKKFRGSVDHVHDEIDKVAGVFFPATARHNREVANAGVRVAVVNEAAKRYTPHLIEKVMWKDAKPEDLQKLGNVLVEMDLRYKKAKFSELGRTEDALKVTNTIGRAGYEFATEAEMQQYMARPEVQESIGRFQREIGGDDTKLSQWFRESKGIHEDQDIAHEVLTKIPGMYIPLLIVDASSPTGLNKGGLRNPKIGQAAFLKESTGSHEYNVNLGDMIEHAVTTQAAYAAKQNLYRVAKRTDEGKWTKGKHEEGWTVFADIHPPNGSQENIAGENSFAVRNRSADDFRDALAPDMPTRLKTIKAFNDMVNTATLTMPTIEAVYHSKNLGTMLMNPGVNVVGLANNFGKVLSKNPEAMQRLVELAFDGISVGGSYQGGSKWNPGTWMGKGLHVLRETMVLTADDAFSKLVKLFHGKIPDTVDNRRDFLNQLGQYERKGQPGWMQILRDSGFGSFATAAGNFAVQGLRSMTGNPGIRTTDATTQAMLRAWKLGKIASVIGVTAAANYLLNGRVDGDDNTPLGALKIGTDKSGKTQYLDLVSLTGLTRGARETGILALAEGQREGRPAGAIMDKAAKDIFHSLLHIAEGPPVQFVHTFITGENSFGTRIAPREASSHALANAQTALLNVNPLVAQIGGYNRAPDSVQPSATEKAWGLLGPYGVKSRDDVNRYNQAMRDVDNERKLAQLKQPGRFPDEARYQKLHSIHGDMQRLQKEYKASTSEERRESIRQMQIRLARSVMR